MDRLKSRRPAVQSNWWVRRFKQFNRHIGVGQIGVYKFTFCSDILSDNVNSKSQSHRYQVFAKVKIKCIYDDNLVEVELLELEMYETANDDIVSLLRKTFNPYIDAKLVKWEVANDEN